MTTHYHEITSFAPDMVLLALRETLKSIPKQQRSSELLEFGKWLKERIEDGDPLTTLKQARTFVREHAGDGVRCPCCTQNAKIYRRPLTSEMADFLVRLVMRFMEVHDWISAADIPTRGGDYAKLVHWGLIEFEDGAPGTGRRAAGKIRPTKTGAEFALDRQSIRSHVVLFANRRLRLEGEPVGIRDIPHFDYSEVMRSCASTISEEALQ